MANIREILKARYGEVPKPTDLEKREYNIVDDGTNKKRGEISETEFLEIQETADIAFLAQSASESNDPKLISIVFDRFEALRGNRPSSLADLIKQL